MLSFENILSAIDVNVLLMIAGTMGIVTLFVESKMPELLADLIMEKVPDVKWAAVSMALFAGVISAFIDNIPYVATMIPVIAGLATALNVDPTVLYFGLLSGVTLGGNCTSIGASANIASIGILRKEGYTVKNSDFFKIGIPFTLAAIIPAYIYLWIMYGV